MNDQRSKVEINTALIAGIGAVIFWFGGLATIACQGYSFLRYGIWSPVSLIEAFKWVSDSLWLTSPHEWMGLHWLLSKIPFSLASMAIGFVVLIAGDD